MSDYYPKCATDVQCPHCNPQSKANEQSSLASATCSVTGVELTETEYPECPNCHERKVVCACLRNTCACGKPVGNITFTVCDDCWNKSPNSKLTDRGENKQ